VILLSKARMRSSSAPPWRSVYIVAIYPRPLSDKREGAGCLSVFRAEGMTEWKRCAKIRKVSLRGRIVGNILSCFAVIVNPYKSIKY